jgi:hypothetical protein
MRAVLASDWGRLFQNWEQETPDESGFRDVGTATARVEGAGMHALLKSLHVLGTCITEAPEFAAARRRRTARRAAR